MSSTLDKCQWHLIKHLASTQNCQGHRKPGQSEKLSHPEQPEETWLPRVMGSWMGCWKQVQMKEVWTCGHNKNPPVLLYLQAHSDGNIQPRAKPIFLTLTFHPKSFLTLSVLSPEPSLTAKVRTTSSDSTCFGAAPAGGHWQNHDQTSNIDW